MRFQEIVEAAKPNTAVAAKLWTAPVKITQTTSPQYVGYIDVTVTAANAQQARILMKAQYGVTDWQIGSVRELK
jgi:hypothetical protein